MSGIFGLNQTGSVRGTAVTIVGFKMMKNGSERTVLVTAVSSLNYQGKKEFVE